MSLNFFLILFLVQLNHSMAFGVGSGISYQGRLIDPSGKPVTSNAVQFRVQIRTPNNEDCLMYEELQVKDLSQSDGMFALTIHDGTGTRLDSSGYGIDQVFANRNSFTFVSTSCTIGTTYTPNPADGRKIQVLFNDGTFDANQWEPAIAMPINFVPLAIESMQIGGYKKEQLIKVADGVPTTSTEISAGDWSALLALIHGTSSQYPSQASFDTLNTSIQTFAKNGLPTCTGSQAITSINGTSFNCVSFGSGTLTGITAAATAGNPISVGGSSISPTIDISVASASTSGYLTSADWSRFDNKQAAGNFVTSISGDITSSGFNSGNVTSTIANNVITDAKINSSANIADSKLATITTPGKVSGAAITSGDIVTTGNYSSSSNISTSANLNLFETSPSTHKISLQSPPSGITDYTIRLPAAVGTPTQVLSITSVSSGVATMGWSSPSSGSVSSISPAATAGNPISIGGTASVPTIDIPAASGSVSGYLSSSDYTSFSNKLSSTLSSGRILVGNGSNVATPVVPTGDISMDNAGIFSVDKIKGKSVSTPTLAGQVLRYDGSSITPNFIAMTDLRSNVTGSVSLPATCGSDQTLTYNSALDNLSCTNISIAGSQVTGNISGNSANVTGTVAIGNGGTGATTQAGAINALLPSQTTKSGQVLSTNGTNISWTPMTTSQWTTSGANIYYNTGSIGIGTNSPTGILDVQGGTAAASTAGSSINFVAQSAGAGASNSGGGYNFTTGAGAGGWPNGNVDFYLGTGIPGTFTINRGSIDSYAPTGTSNYPDNTMMLLDNSWDGNGNLANQAFFVRNSSSTHQAAYFGAVSISGAANYSPALVWGQATGTSSYQERMRLDSNGHLGIGTTSPSAQLHLAAGTTAANTAPLKLTAGVNLTTPEAGAIEFDGTNLFYTTAGGVRQTVGTSAGGLTALTGDVTASGSGSVAATVASVGGSTAANVHTAELAVNTNATSSSTASVLVKRDASGISSFKSLKLDGATSGLLTMSVPTTVTSYTITWPNAVASTANSVLASGTDGTLNWVNLSSIAGSASLTSQVSGVLPIANGGTNSSTALSNNQLMVSNTGAIKELGSMTDGQIIVGKAASAPQIVSMSGDVTISNTGVSTIGKIGGTTVSGVGLSNNNVLQNNSGSSIAANNMLLSNGTATGVTSLSTPVSGVLIASGSIPSWATLTSDSFTQYALLAGRSTGQSLKGGTAASENLTLDSTAHATKGSVIIAPSGGSVGIGTNSPTGFFEVQGGTAAAATNGKSISLYAQNGGSGNRNGGNILLIPGVESGSGSPGYVGIGNSTPSFKLDVEAASQPFSAIDPAAFFASANSSAQDSGSSIGIGGYDGVTYSRNYAMLGGFKENATSGNYAGYMAFATRPNGGVPLERMRITSTGNVGIGMTPTQKLDVTGNINVNSGSAYMYNGANVIRGQTTSLSYFIGNSGNLTMTGTENTSLGDSAFNANTTGSFNVAIGGNAMLFNTTGYQNTAIGKSALKANTTGYNNTAVGYHALYVNTTGTLNSSFGSDSLVSNTTGSSNTGIGNETLYYNTTGNDNTAVGKSTLVNNTTGDQNTAMGIWALSSNSTGSNNVAIGDNALANNTTANSNTAIGFHALAATTTGTYNTSVGANSMELNTTGVRNTAIGRNSLSSNTTGNYNIAIGHGSGSAITTGSYNVILGSNDGTSIATLTNYIIISDGAGTERMRIDNNGNMGIGVTGPTTKLQVAGEISPSVDNTYSLGDATLRYTAVYAVNGAIQTSDLRQKQNIKDSDLGLEFINSLRPVSYLWKSGPDRNIHYGLIAQETEKSILNYHTQSLGEKTPIVDHDEKTDRYGLRYSELISPIIKSIQDLFTRLVNSESHQSSQDREISALKLENTSKEQKLEVLQKENEDLKKRLERIEKALNLN